MRERLEKLLAEGRDNALLRFGLGNACLQDDDAESAVIHLQQATLQNPAYSAAWKLLGVALRKLERLDEAEAAWNSGLKVAQEQGDLQAVKEMTVFVKRLHKAN
ncbi:Tetratricopeptide repeat protein [compost metagenome]